MAAEALSADLQAGEQAKIKFRILTFRLPGFDLLVDLTDFFRAGDAFKERCPVIE
jgi:hypothetical protein